MENRDLKRYMIVKGTITTKEGEVKPFEQKFLIDSEELKEYGDKSIISSRNSSD